MKNCDIEITEETLDKIAMNMHKIYMNKIEKLAGELALDIHEICGGEVLQTQTIYQLIIKKFEKLGELVGI